MPKCMKFGWLLPYTPFKRELGAWKAHYVDCVTSINAKPLSKVRNNKSNCRHKIFKF